MLDAMTLIRELVAVPGPPGGEEAVCTAVQRHANALGYETFVDVKGNLLVPLGRHLPERNACVVVTAHLDEIALMVSAVEPDGALRVVAMGGLYPYKWGEQPVEIHAARGILTGIVSFGSIHTNAPASVAQQARTAPLGWEQATIFTGLSADDLEGHGVRPGVRVTLARERRQVTEMGQLIGSYFLDDRADLVAWLLALETLRNDNCFPKDDIVFAATTAEEVGGEGANYLLQRYLPDVCIALEIGPSVPESPFVPDDQPTIWVRDSYSAMTARDGERVANCARELGLHPHWQALSRGGSDASCAAHLGLCARPITLGLPVENSHGYEIMHREAPETLARLLAALLRELT